MDKLFELSATLTLDAAAFLHGLHQAEQAARAAEAMLARLQSSAVSSWAAVAAAIRSATDQMREFLALRSSGDNTPGFATGLSYVPYDNFPARLHEGEAVLTRLEAEQWRSGEATQPAVDPAMLTSSLVSALAGVTVQLDGQRVGQLVAPTVNREIAREAGRRWAV